MIRNRSYQDDLSAIRAAERDLRRLPIAPWERLPDLPVHPDDRLSAKERLVVSGICGVLSVAILTWALLG